LDTVNGYQFTFLPLEDIDVLKKEWSIIEGQSDIEFFLSWTWISTWIETYRPNINILRAFFDTELVAIAALVFRKEHRYYILRSKTLHVHQTGDPEQDQIWIEYNGILAKQEHKEEVTKSSIAYLGLISEMWDELIVGAITDSEASLLENAGDLMRHDLWEAPCYGVDLKTIRESQKSYLQTLSRNTRYQIKRSIKKYQNNGEIQILSAERKAEALQSFDDIGPLHVARWGAGFGESGFANLNFTKFHRSLISTAWDKGQVDLISVRANGKIIARFYNFIYRNRVYFYLSGLALEQDNQLKPGLTGHALCIQRYIDAGYDFYDFMGGGERYKSSLAHKHQHLVKIALQKKKIKFKLEKLGRGIKNYFRKDVSH